MRYVSFQGQILDRYNHDHSLFCVLDGTLPEVDRPAFVPDVVPSDCKFFVELDCPGFIAVPSQLFEGIERLRNIRSKCKDYALLTEEDKLFALTFWNTFQDLIYIVPKEEFHGYKN